MQKEFECIQKYIEGKGIDIGCGTNRISPHVLAIDSYDYKNADFKTQAEKKKANDIVHNCKDLNVKNTPIEFNGYMYSFNDNELDFIFSSHCLEDFEDIPTTFLRWWAKLKPNGLMILLLPDMEACNCAFCINVDAVKHREEVKKSARYWTIEDYEKHGKGNPAHRTNVGKRYISGMLDALPIKYEWVQSDTLKHNETCTVDIVLRKKT